MTKEDKLNADWYVNLNDLIGGYAIGTVEGRCSENRNCGDVADFMSKEVAEFIIECKSQIELILEENEYLYDLVMDMYRIGDADYGDEINDKLKEFVKENTTSTIKEIEIYD